MKVSIRRAEIGSIDGEVWLCAVLGIVCLFVEYAASALHAAGMLSASIGNGLAGHLASSLLGAVLMAMRQHLSKKEENANETQVPGEGDKP